MLFHSVGWYSNYKMHVHTTVSVANILIFKTDSYAVFDLFDEIYTVIILSNIIEI